MPHKQGLAQSSGSSHAWIMSWSHCSIWNFTHPLLHLYPPPEYFRFRLSLLLDMYIQHTWSFSEIMDLDDSDGYKVRTTPSRGKPGLGKFTFPARLLHPT